MTPNVARLNTDPAYLRGLLKAAGLSQEKAAKLVGVGTRTMRYYLSEGADHIPAPYVVQFALEQLAAGQRETAECMRLVGYLIVAAGGKVRITRGHIVTGLPLTSSIVRRDDPETGDILFSIEHAQEGQGNDI